MAESKDSYTCGLTGRTVTAAQLKDDVEFLARALSTRLGWKVNEGKELEKVAVIFTMNTVGALVHSLVTGLAQCVDSFAIS